MPRKRIHELAKEWGMDTRYLLSRLEELGVQGKKAQSTLTDEEISLVRPGPAVPDTLALVLGEEKIVGERVVTELDQQAAPLLQSWQQIKSHDLPALNQQLKSANLPELKLEAEIKPARAVVSSKDED